MFWCEHYDFTRTDSWISADDCQTCAANLAILIGETDKAAEASVTAYHCDRRGAACEEGWKGKAKGELAYPKRMGQGIRTWTLACILFMLMLMAGTMLTHNRKTRTLQGIITRQTP